MRRYLPIVVNVAGEVLLIVSGAAFDLRLGVATLGAVLMIEAREAVR